MSETARERTVLPLGVPLGIFAVILFAVFLFSRILLNVPRQVAVAVALMTALNILVTCGVLAVRKVQGGTAFALVLVIALPVIIGGAAAAKTFKVKGPAKVVAAAPPVVLTAKDIAFSTSNLSLPAPDATIDFKNQDTVPHNVHIYDGADATAPTVFVGTVIPGGSSATYKVTGLKEGSTYFFHCDVHPTQMTGKVTAVAAGAAQAAGAVTTGPITISSANTLFNKTSLDIAANTPTTVTLRNADSVPHNFNLYSGPSGYTPPAAPGPVQPGASETYKIPGLAAGTYKYRCDYHPSNMQGTLTVH